MVPSHYSLEDLLQQGSFYPCPSTYIQLFQAVPAVACDNAGIDMNSTEEKRNVDAHSAKRPDGGNTDDTDDDIGGKVDSLYLPYISATEFYVFSSDGDSADGGDGRKEERLQYLKRFTLTTGASRQDKIAGADVLKSFHGNSRTVPAFKDSYNNGTARMYMVRPFDVM